MKLQTCIVTGLQLQSCREILFSLTMVYVLYELQNAVCVHCILSSLSQCERLNISTNVYEIRDWRSLQKVEQV